MKAIVQSRYGGPDVFRLCEIPRPVPRQGEILVRVHATSVTSSEANMRQGLPFYGRPILGWFRPRRPLLGLEFAGTVEQCGPGARRLAVGTKVFGFTGFRCGAYAQFLVVSENDSVEAMPEGASFEEAVALVDGPTTAWFFLHKARLRRGERVLVNGASGSIGTAAVQLAAWMGAEVTAVCSASKHEQVRALGAHQLIDYHTEDFTSRHDAWDVVFDTVGKSTFCRCRRSLRTNGRYLSTVLGGKLLLQVAMTALLCDKKAMFGMSVDKRTELLRLRELVEAGQHVAVIDRVFELEEMSQAHAYVDSGRKFGNVVVHVGQDPS